MHAETDYLAEVQHLARFGALLAGSDIFALPTLHDALCTPQFLAMRYMESAPLDSLVDAPGEALVLETDRALRVLEIHHAPSYDLPPEDIHATLHPVQGSGYCEWKGVARYFDVIVGDKTSFRAAWCYDSPTAHFAAPAGYVAFYGGLMDEASVGDLRVIPQPGDFYGG